MTNTPYYGMTSVPKSSCFGIVDTAGFAKDENGNEIARDRIATARDVTVLDAHVDRQVFTADGKDHRSTVRPAQSGRERSLPLFTPVGIVGCVI